MGRSRSVATRDRDARAVELRRRNLHYRQIADQLGLKSTSAAYDAVRRGLADQHQENADEVRRMELDRLDDIARGFWRVFGTRHYVVSAGKGEVVMDPTDPQHTKPLVDDGPVIQAGLALIKIMERRSRYLGLDAPARTRVEVITQDMVEAQIIALEAQLADNDETTDRSPA